MSPLNFSNVVLLDEKKYVLVRRLFLLRTQKYRFGKEIEICLYNSVFLVNSVYLFQN